jgi:hypothetical protein
MGGNDVEENNHILNKHWLIFDPLTYKEIIVASLNFAHS